MENKKEILKKAKKLLDPRIKTLSEITKWVDYLIVDELEDYNTDLLLKGFSKLDTLEILRTVVAKIRDNGVEQSVLSDSINTIRMKFDTKRGNIMWPIRVAISGKKVALPLFESIEILGKQKTITRLENAIIKLEEYDG